MTKKVSALKARRNLGELLNRAYYKDEEIIIEKKGKAVAKLVRFETTHPGKKDLFAAAAGSWKDLDTEKIKAIIKTTKADKSRAKKFLADW